MVWVLDSYQVIITTFYNFVTKITTSHYEQLHSHPPCSFEFMFQICRENVFNFVNGLSQNSMPGNCSHGPLTPEKLANQILIVDNIPNYD